jgi:hypothetical protein
VGSYTGASPAAISVQVLDRFGTQQQALTAYPGTIGSGTFTVQGGDLRTLGATTARVLVSNGAGTTVPLLVPVQGFVPAVPARIGMNQPPISAFGAESHFSNTTKFTLKYQNLNDQDNGAAMLPFLDAAGNVTSAPSNGYTFRAGPGEGSGNFFLTYRVDGGSPIISVLGESASVNITGSPVAVSGKPGYYRIPYTITFDKTVGRSHHAIFRVTGGGWINDIDTREVGRDENERYRAESVARYALYSIIRPMDPMSGNANGYYEGDWSGRTLPTDAMERNVTGIAVEDIIGFHNAVNVLRLSQGKDKAALFVTPPLYASADYWFKFMRALCYGEYTTNGVALIDGTPLLVALNGNEEWNFVAGSSGKASIDIAFREGRATAGEVAPGNGAGRADIVRREYVFNINKNGPRVVAAVPDKMGTVIREVNLQLSNGEYEARYLVENGADLANFEMFTAAPYPGDTLNEIDNSRDLDVLFPRLNAEIDEYDTKIGLLKAYCTSVGKRLAFYEGNKSLFRTNLTFAEQQAFDGDPRMKTAMARIIDIMAVRGDYIALYLNSGAQQNAPNPSFGWQRYPGDDSWPPRQALLEAIAALPVGQR